MNEQYAISREEHGAVFASNLMHLRKEQILCDVTLVSADEKQLMAHKLVLASCSELFSKMFTKNVHQHPFVYLSGISSQDINLILDYIYKGEAKVFESEVDLFLDTAKKLKITGLCTNEETQIKLNGENSKFIKEDSKKFEDIVQPAEIEMTLQKESKVNNIQNQEHIHQEIEGTTKDFERRIKTTEDIILPARNKELQLHQILPKGRQSFLKKQDESNVSQTIVKVVNSGQNLENLINEIEGPVNVNPTETKSKPDDYEPPAWLKDKLEELGDFKLNRCRANECEKYVQSTHAFVRHLLDVHLKNLTCFFCNKSHQTETARRAHFPRCKQLKKITEVWFSRN